MLGRLSPRWLAAQLAALLCVSAAAASGQTIDNTARADWREGSTQRFALSNTVSVAVHSAPVAISVYRAAPDAGTRVALRPSLCNGSELIVPGLSAGTEADLSAVPASTLRAGQTLLFQVSAPSANRDDSAVDRLAATLSTSSGDRETLEFFETGPNTGLFAGAIATRRAPPVTGGDCRLSVAQGDEISITVSRAGDATPLAATRVSVLADPFGVIFDSEDGSLIDGARVTLLDESTGAPAIVFAEDGVTPWPSTVISGTQVVDAAGTSYDLGPGEFWFPLAPLGRYRLSVEPPSPYSAPSAVTPDRIALLAGPGGRAFIVSNASYGAGFDLDSATPVQVDIPLDRPNVSVTLTKSASRVRAQPGDPVLYTVTLRNPDPSRSKTGVTLADTSSPWLRLRADSVRVDGRLPEAGALTIAPDGRRMTLAVAAIAPGAATRISYAMVVRADAPPGQALNRAEASDSRGARAVAEATVKIERDDIASRMTIIGQITEGACGQGEGGRGIGGVRVMLEDGSFAVTDRDGRYHFEGVTPGTHVVQAQRQTLPGVGGRFVDCDQSTRSAGSPSSRFVTGQGGSLVVADFAAEIPQWQPLPDDAEVQGDEARGTEGLPLTPASRRDSTAETIDAAGGGDRDWFAEGDGPPAFLFPAAEHNPRAPAVRVVVRHAPGHSVRLTASGRPVDPLSFDGSKVSPDGRFAISIWRGIPLSDETTHLLATVIDQNGATVASLERDVAFVSGPWNAELVTDRTTLVADGTSRPVIAVRLTDRRGRPVRSGVSGSVAINAPYESAAMLDRLQLRQLAGAGSPSPNWVIKGDDGIALIELAPTMISGPLHLQFNFSDEQVSRRRDLDAWVVPGDLEWTVIGLAEGSAGARSVAQNMERSGRFDSDLGDDARVALYAKGRVLGKFLLTMAYDSAKQRDDQRLLGTIDPDAYYSVFADGSDRRFDAASTEKLYVRIESRTFYALYGDLVTGFDQTVLARYDRTMTGLKAEGLFGRLHVQGFAADAATRFRRDELQGAGISGPYKLSSRALVANSEQVALEVRDRFRSELIVERRELVRFVDYDIDLLAGTIRFREPVLSRDLQLNPQFIVVDYEVEEGAGEAHLNAGVRADYTWGGDRVRIGASAIRDEDADQRTDIGAIDVRARIGAATEIRAELAASEREGATAKAWLLEAEHRTGSLDLLAYAREVEEGFGTGHINGAEAGRRKFGADARYSVSERLSVTATAWRDDSLADAASRTALQASIGYRSNDADARLGISHFADRTPSGERNASTLLEGAVTYRLLGNRLELGMASSLALDEAESIDLPARHRLRAAYALTDWMRLIGNYEIANGKTIDARTFNAGVELSPWSGSRLITSLGQQDIGELGKRSFAAFGLSQNVPLTAQLSIDASVDGSRTLSGADPFAVINPEHPVASGGHLSQEGALFEDFSAATLGLSWRHDQWAATGRAEYRDGQFADRRGLTAGLIRQLGDGKVVGSGFSWTRAAGSGSVQTEIFDAALSAAYRPTGSAISALAKLSFRSDRVSGAVEGDAGPAGRTALVVTGDARSDRLVASLSANWSPRGSDNDEIVRRSEIGLFLGARQGLDRYDGFNLSGTTLLAGLDARVGIGERLEIGGVATVRASLQDDVTSFSVGPQIGFVPAKDTLVTVGYNVAGFRDADFSAARSTDRGLYASVRLKFDADSFTFLGLGRR